MNSTLKLTIKNIEKKTDNKLWVTLTYTPRNDTAIYTSVVEYTGTTINEISVEASVGRAVTDLDSIINLKDLKKIFKDDIFGFGTFHTNKIENHIGESFEIKAL